MAWLQTCQRWVHLDELRSKGLTIISSPTWTQSIFSEWLLQPVSGAGHHLGLDNLHQTGCIARAGRDKATMFRAPPSTMQRWSEPSKSTQLISVWGFPGGSAVKNLPANARDVGLVPGSGRSLGVGNSNPFQYPGLGDPMDRGAWQAIVHGVVKSWTWFSN